MESPLYTIEQYSPTINSSVLPNISTSRTHSSPYTRPHTLLFTTTPLSPPSPTSPSDRRENRKHIARPPNAFLIFRSAFLKESRIPSHAETRQQNLSKVIGQCWNMMSPTERAEWDAKAEAVKQAHMARYPGYKFTPSRKTRAPRRVSAAAKARNETSEKEKEEATRKLREEFTQYKGEPVLSRRNSKMLARSVRGTERAARPTRKAKASTPTSASTSTSSPTSTFTSTSTSTHASTTSAATSSTAASPSSQPHPRSLFTTLLSPLPLRAAPFAHLTNFTPFPFLPSSTHLTPAPSAGPQIMRITQSPPLTPFHPSDRQPQLQQIQLPQLSISLCAPSMAPAHCNWDFHQEHTAFEMGCGVEAGVEDKFDAFNAFGEANVSVYQGNVYPTMGGDYASTNASAYFNGTRGGIHQGSVVDLCAINVNMHQYLNLDPDVDYSAYSNSYMGNYRDAPTPATPAEYDSPAAFSAFSPVVSSSSPSSPSSISSASASSPPQPQTPVSPVSNGSPASFVYPDSPVSESLDSTATLVYPVPSPDHSATGDLTLTVPYADDYTHSRNYNKAHHDQHHEIKLDENDDQVLRQTEFVNAHERKYSSSEHEVGGLSMGVHAAQDEAALNRGAHGAFFPWSQQPGASGLEVEFGGMGYL